MRSKKSAIAVTAVVMGLLVFTASGFATVIAHSSGTRIPTAGFASTVFATKTPSSLIYAQNPDFVLKYASQNDFTFPNFAAAYDNFTLGTSHNIDMFDWVGGYLIGTPKGVITGFTLTFYADAGNQPGAVLATYSGAGNFGETFIVGSNQFYTYSWTLAAPFAASAGTEYWASIVPDLDLPSQWGWGTSSSPDHFAWQCYFGTCGAVSTDFAFALYSTIPEPGTLVLMGSGLLGLAAVIRRKLF
ncbi:MAG TPA: PEP-CTERM sorting domain-containing protein [Terriglobales bacterium]